MKNFLLFCERHDIKKKFERLALCVALVILISCAGFFSRLIGRSIALNLHYSNANYNQNLRAWCEEALSILEHSGGEQHKKLREQLSRPLKHPDLERRDLRKLAASIHDLLYALQQDTQSIEAYQECRSHLIIYCRRYKNGP